MSLATLIKDLELHGRIDSFFNTVACPECAVEHGTCLLWIDGSYTICPRCGELHQVGAHYDHEYRHLIGAEERIIEGLSEDSKAFLLNDPIFAFHWMKGQL